MKNKIIPEETITNFKKELKNLLTKYDAAFYVDLKGDSHCTEVFIVVDINNIEIFRRRDELSDDDLKNMIENEDNEWHDFEIEISKMKINSTLNELAEKIQ